MRRVWREREVVMVMRGMGGGRLLRQEPSGKINGKGRGGRGCDAQCQQDMDPPRCITRPPALLHLSDRCRQWCEEDDCAVLARTENGMNSHHSGVRERASLG